MVRIAISFELLTVIFNCSDSLGSSEDHCGQNERRTTKTEVNLMSAISAGWKRPQAKRSKLCVQQTTNKASEDYHKKHKGQFFFLQETSLSGVSLATFQHKHSHVYIFSTFWSLFNDKPSLHGSFETLLHRCISYLIITSDKGGCKLVNIYPLHTFICVNKEDVAYTGFSQLRTEGNPHK